MNAFSHTKSTDPCRLRLHLDSHRSAENTKERPNVSRLARVGGFYSHRGAELKSIQKVDS